MDRASNAGTKTDTIFALSSGAPPAAIAIIRVSGPRARHALELLGGALPEARHAALRSLRNEAGEMLDHALILWCPGPATVTGEDVAEFHLHGGRAVIEAVSSALIEAECRPAVPGEFTRRALFNGKMDVSSVEGLADLLAAETESQRRDALRRADGAISRKFASWRQRLTLIAAQLEAAIDYDGEEDVDGAADGLSSQLADLMQDMRAALAVAPAERLREGVRVAIVGPPNAGKSTLFNALVGRDAAIVSEIAGTTRDTNERSVAIDGVPFVFIDTAGLRDAIDPIERIGVERARAERALADIVIDLGGTAAGDGIITVSAKADIVLPRVDTLAVSAATGDGISALQSRLCEMGRTALPAETELALDRRYRRALAHVLEELAGAEHATDILLLAEHIRLAGTRLDAILGSDGTEDMLDALFSRFCLGK